MSVNKTIFFLFLFISVYVYPQQTDLFWLPVDTESNRLLSLLESFNEDDEDIQVYVDSLKHYAQQTNHPILKARALYWDAYYQRNRLDGDYGIQLLKNAIELIDTVKYDYDYARMRYQILYNMRRGEDYIFKYKESNTILKVFEKYHDWRNIGNTYRYIGSVFAVDRKSVV